MHWKAYRTGMNIELLYVPDCPNRHTARRHLDAALAQRGLTAAVREREIASPEEAERFRMHGSPTIRIDGQDPFAGLDARPSLACRLYHGPYGPSGAPTVEQLTAVLPVRGAPTGTEPTGCCPPTHMDRAIISFRRHAFAALLAGETPRVADLAAAAGRDTPGVSHAVAWLEDHGQLERDHDLLVGAHGLTRRTTPHTFTIDSRTLHTWCAYDAIAIPVALAATAQTATTCPACRRSLTIDIDAGQLPRDNTPVLWMPHGPCERVIDDFCPHANLFCDAEHVHDWRRAAGDPAGEILTLARVPALACRGWADIATLP